MRTILKGLVPLAALAFSSQPALANGKSEGSMQVSATVPVACSLDTRSFTLSDNRDRVTGTLFESCNTNRGFQVLAMHRQLGQNEQVRVRYGNEESLLHPTGFSYIAMRAGARFGPVPVEIDAADIDQPIAISFSLTAV